MQHTIAAVFDERSHAQQALDDLLASGFSSEDVHLSQSETNEAMGQTGRSSASKSRDDESKGGGIRSFFSEIFGTHQRDDADLYSEAVMHGHYVLTVNAPDDELVERATDVLDKYSPVDIDEQASKWKSGGWAAQDSMQQNLHENQNAEQQTKAESQGESKAIPVIQEELKVGKRAVQRGGVRVFQRVVEKPVEENVNLREERVTVERRPVDQSDQSLRQVDTTAFKEQSFEMRETVEEPVVEKVARVVEEVIVGKDVQQRQEKISDRLRRTEVEVEQLSGRSDQSAATDDAYFRSHWNSNYASSGGSYDDYAPAYRYGSTLASNERYKGVQWDDMEADVRSDWEAKNPHSTWEKMKSAIRQGWERMRG